jgi:hypothetical protein
VTGGIAAYELCEVSVFLPSLLTTIGFTDRTAWELQNISWSKNDTTWVYRDASNIYLLIVNAD